MRIGQRQFGDVVVLDLVGPLAGWKAAGAVEDTVRRHGRAGTRTVVANMARVQSVDLAGLGALVEAYSTMREGGGEMRLASLTKRIHDLVVITRLLTVFNTFDSVEEAVQGQSPALSDTAEPAQVSSMSLGMIHRFLRRA
jgi:anti-sigma B factor antagonist